MSLLPNGWLASGTYEGTTKVWTLEEKEEVRTLPGHTYCIVSLKAAKIGNSISYSKDGISEIWSPYLSDLDHGGTLEHEWLLCSHRCLEKRLAGDIERDIQPRRECFERFFTLDVLFESVHLKNPQSAPIQSTSHRRLLLHRLNSMLIEPIYSSHAATAELASLPLN